MFPILFTSIFLLVVFLGAVDVARRYWQIPLVASPVIALALIVAIEALVLNVLSLVSGVRAFPLLLFHIVLLGGWWFWRLSRGEGAQFLLHQFSGISRRLKRGRNLLFIFFPLLIIILLPALLYPPNTYDSLSYHMARVVHWMQFQSINYYPTPIERQNVMGPGAEYLILVAQILSNSDVLSNFVQMLSYLVILGGVLVILRVTRVPRKIHPAIVILVASSPMAVLQATSTQTDLVAAAMTIAILIAGRRLYCGNITRMKLRDFILLSLCICSGFLVKPTSLVAAAPFLLCGVLLQLRRIFSTPGMVKQFSCWFAICVAVIALFAGPDIYRKQSVHSVRYEVYPLSAEWGKERFQNIIAISAHSAVLPPSGKRFLRQIGYDGAFENQHVLTIHEDLTGNPFQFYMFLFLGALNIVLLPVAWKNRQHMKYVWLSFCPYISWILFGLIVRDQLWIVRLQLPLFYVFPLAFILPFAVLQKRKILSSGFSTCVSVVAFLSLAYGMLIGCLNPHRPLRPEHFFGFLPDRTAAYYNNTVPSDRVDHQQLLDLARGQGCDRIGLLLRGNSVDYPLSWRLLRENRQAKHLTLSSTQEEFSWSCLYYVESPADPRLAMMEIPLTPLGKKVYGRDLQKEFEMRGTACLTMQPNLPNEQFRFGATSQTEVSRDDSGWKLTSTGQDPQVTLPVGDCRDKEYRIVRVRMESPVETVAQIYYAGGDQIGYRERNSYKTPVHPGENELYFLLLGEDLQNLRFDPATKTGTYVVRSIEVR